MPHPIYDGHSEQHLHPKALVGFSCCSWCVVAEKVTLLETNWCQLPKSRKKTWLPSPQGQAPNIVPKFATYALSFIGGDDPRWRPQFRRDVLKRCSQYSTKLAKTNAKTKQAIPDSVWYKHKFSPTTIRSLINLWAPSLILNKSANGKIPLLSTLTTASRAGANFVQQPAIPSAVQEQFLFSVASPRTCSGKYRSWN